jgi:adenosylhomocysteinase
LKTIKSWCNVLQTNREELKQDSVIDFIGQIVQNDTFAIIDIGGYFVPKVDKIQSAFKGQLLKVIEDTENGYQKYVRSLEQHNISVPVLSVARSSLKIEEDYLVGHEIVVKSEMFLADYGTTFLGKKYWLSDLEKLEQVSQKIGISEEPLYMWQINKR